MVELFFEIDYIDHYEKRDLILYGFKELSSKEKAIVIMRNGLDDNMPKTLIEISKNYHCTRERIRQIECRAYRKLRKALEVFMV